MLKGKVHKFGANVDTDAIIPARHLNVSDPEALAAHCMEDIDRDFAGKVQPGDIIVATTNFGCGSSREHAPLAIKAAGISCIIAKSFARIFFRNAINIGLPLLECGEAVDNTGLTWTTTGSADWFRQTTFSYYDGDAAQSGSIADGQATSLTTTVNGPGTLTFYWKVSSESSIYTGYDFLKFYLDGEQRTEIAGSVDWQQKTYYITSGTHTLEWKYTKDSAGSEGSDCGWVDKVEFAL